MNKKQAETFLIEALKNAKEAGLINTAMVEWVLKSVKRSKHNQTLDKGRNEVKTRTRM